jgi:hypothetical protein
MKAGANAVPVCEIPSPMVSFEHDIASANAFSEWMRKVAKVDEELQWATLGERAALKKQIVDDLAKRMVKDSRFQSAIDAIRHETTSRDYFAYHARSLAQEYVDLWAKTSGDSHSRAIAMQLAARDELQIIGAADRHFESAVFSQAMLVKDRQMMRVFIRAQYDATQEVLKKAGIERVTLFRGAIMPGHAGESTLKLQPISSFSTKLQTAVQFAEEAANTDEMSDAMVMVITVGREQLVSTAVSGVGCLTESEVLLRGGSLKAMVFKPRTIFDPDVFDDLEAQIVKAVTKKKPPKKLKRLAGEQVLEPDADIKNADWPKVVDDVL